MIKHEDNKEDTNLTKNTRKERSRNKKISAN